MDLAVACSVGRHSGSSYAAEYSLVGSHRRSHNGSHKETRESRAIGQARHGACPVNIKQSSLNLLDIMETNESTNMHSAKFIANMKTMFVQ